MVKKKKRVVKSSSSKSHKLRDYAFGHALGLVSSICLLFYAVMTWFSSYTGEIIVEQFPIVFSFSDWTLIIGLVETYALSYIFGWIFVKIYNRT